MSRDSSVGTVTRLLDGRQRNKCSIPCVAKRSLPSTKWRDRRLFFSEYSGPDVKLAAHLRLVPRLRNSGTYLHFHMCLYGVYTDNFTF